VHVQRFAFFFACARSDPATDFTVALVLLLLSSVLAFDASFLLVVIAYPPSKNGDPPAESINKLLNQITPRETTGAFT